MKTIWRLPAAVLPRSVVCFGGRGQVALAVFLRRTVAVVRSHGEAE